ncbi:MAG: hypothetical protein HY286_14995 [Planctomycetes bacterium]|nr:hypothetical protein [Planctomycetota bacterium]
MRIFIKKQPLGFSLLEVVLVMAVFIGAAGVVLPLLYAEMQDSKITRAIDDTSRIAQAISQSARATGAMPGEDEPNMPCAALLSSGTRPGGLPLGRNLNLFTILSKSAAGAESQPAQGPYLGDVGADPFNRAYVVLVPAKGSPDHCWVLCAGRDGIIQTTEKDSTLRGDDIGVCLR